MIVAPECYVTASCSIFSKQQLLEKERIVYGSVSWPRIRMGALRAVKLGCLRLNLPDRIDRGEEILSVVVKLEETAGWKDSKLIYAVLSLLQLDGEEQLTNEDIISLAQQL